MTHFASIILKKIKHTFSTILFYVQEIYTHQHNFIRIKGKSVQHNHYTGAVAFEGMRL